MAKWRERDYRDFEYEIGKRVRFNDAWGDQQRGTITGRGAAGGYLEIRGDDGEKYAAHSSDSDLSLIFDDDDDW